jgi:hypothetical protein
MTAEILKGNHPRPFRTVGCDASNYFLNARFKAVVGMISRAVRKAANDQKGNNPCRRRNSGASRHSHGASSARGFGKTRIRVSQLSDCSQPSAIKETESHAWGVDAKVSSAERADSMGETTDRHSHAVAEPAQPQWDESKQIFM